MRPLALFNTPRPSFVFGERVKTTYMEGLAASNCAGTEPSGAVAQEEEEETAKEEVKDEL